ncbi:hypothetical protein LS73_008265 [Helicobacter muridarum]|uniref:Type I restriction enzyme R protein C-terminal domain-containing protein n=2 Tax=Helicobacter muridarum TaxID=216 RepID=A0A4U8TFF0_9HELI|nr:hypothetical protein [Helicobacter muridarum]TLD98806.1 hypothetical protein LS73_008265 [Helicobacter muridarum]
MKGKSKICKARICKSIQRLNIKEKNKEADISDDLVFELELMKQVDINLDYIMHLIDQMKDKNDEDREKKIQDLRRLIDSSLNLRSKKDLIEEFIAQINPQSDIDNEFSTFIEKKMKEELNTIIDDLNLNAEQSYIFINKSFDV